MRILITGAAGMLGQDVRRAAAGDGHEVLALTRSELDIADARQLDEALASARPEVVINCAAWTDVDGAEASPEAAAIANGDGPGRLGSAAAAAGAWTVHISSDYVFDGGKREAYLESDPVGPISAYGRSKLAGERALAAAAPEAHTIVRTAWLFGTQGPCFPETILRLAAERETLNVVSDQIGSPTFTGHLAPALLTLATARVPGVVHVTASGECSWFQFAREIVAARGLDCEVSPCSTQEFPRPARRPAYSVLRSERGEFAPALPHWRDGLTAYLSARAEVLA